MNEVRAAGEATAHSALTGVRVLDLSTGLAGELAAMILGDFGADVIRVEPKPSQVATPGAPTWGRNKRIARTEAPETLLAALTPDADVLVVTTDAAEHSARRAAAERPDLIILRLANFRVPEDVPSHQADALMAAATGIARRQSSNDGGPVESVFPYLTYEHGLWAATCTVAALVERERSGLGQRVFVDGMHSALITSAATMVVDPDAPVRSTAVGPHGPNPAYSTYRCQDGKWLLIGALLPKFQTAAFNLLGTSDIIADERIDGDHSKLYAVENRDWVRQRIATAFLTRPRDEWLELLRGVDCPASEVAEPGQFLDHPQVVALGLRREVEDPSVGRVEMPWVPVDLIGTPATAPSARRYTESPAWLPRERGRPIGPTGTISSDETHARGPLAGFRVLDLGAVLAGPLSASLLAELGADVIKVEPPVGDQFRSIGWHYNRGQRSLALDLRSPKGHSAFESVVRASDAVVDNFRPGVLARLGIDYAHLSKVRPDIVTASITGFGDVGPMAGRPGFDPILQAASGMMAAQGGNSDPVFSSIAVNDVSAACVTALGVCLGLYHRARTGNGQRISVSLTAVAAFMQCEELTRYAGREPVRLGGDDYQGPTATDRLYPTADGWLRVHLPTDSLDEVGILDPSSDLGSDIANALTVALSELDTAEAIKRIVAAGGAATAAVTFLDLIQDPAILDAGYFHKVVRPDGKAFFAPGRYALFSRSVSTAVHRAPGLGEQSRQVLRESGLTDTEVDDLVATGIVTQGGPLTDFGVAIYR